ncbi:unnamed protein product, partial [Linum tenue]
RRRGLAASQSPPRRSRKSTNRTGPSSAPHSRSKQPRKSPPSSTLYTTLSATSMNGVGPNHSTSPLRCRGNPTRNATRLVQKSSPKVESSMLGAGSETR